MNILAIDTTGLVASCAIVDEHKTLGEFSTNIKMTHSQTIMPMVDKLLEFTGLSLSDMDYFACSTGPGSFTGIRIGVATVMGLSFGAGKKIVPVSALDALAYNAYMTNAIVAPIMDARRNQVYGCFYKYEDGKLVRLCEYFAKPVGECLEDALAYGKDVLFLGDGVLPNEEILKVNGVYTAHQAVNMQRAATVGALAVSLVTENENAALLPSEVKPFYIRLPQAERERVSGILRQEMKGSENLD